MFCNWIHVCVHSSYPEQKQDPHRDFDIKYVFSFMSRNRPDWIFGFLCHEGRRLKGLGRTTNKYIPPTFSRMSLARVNFSGSKSFRIHRVWKLFSNKDMMLACVFNSFVLLKILCLAKWEVNLVCSCSHRLLSLIDSRCDPVSKWALKQKTAGNLSLGAWDR